MSDDRLVVDVSQLRRHTGERREYRSTPVVDGLRLPSADVEVEGGRLDLDLVVESVTEGVVVVGRIGGRWSGACRRCLEPTTGAIDVDVHEIFEARPTEGETWPLVENRIDLAPMVWEAALLALPLTPLCGEACTGPDPERFAVATDDPAAERPPDPRWAALDDLTFD